MVRVSSSRKFTEQKRFTPHCCWMRMHIPFAKVYWQNTVCPTLLRMVHTLLTQKFTERIRFAPHCCWMVRTSRSQNFTERIRLLLNGTYPANTKFYKVLYAWQCVLRCLKYKMDCRREKNVCKHFVYNQTVTLVTLVTFYPLHLWREESSKWWMKAMEAYWLVD